VTHVTHVSLDARPRLRARSEPLPDPGDLLDHLAPGGFAWLDHDGTGFVTAGSVASVPAGHVEAALATIDHEARPATPRAAGPRAVGALPFAGDAALIVPARIVGRDDEGRGWVTRIATLDPPAPLQLAEEEPQRFEVCPVTGRAEWDAMVNAALREIGRGALAKVVLARAVDVAADTPFWVRTVLARLRAEQRGCRVYADGGFVGASPELLVRRDGEDVVARPLAGTGTDAHQLLGSDKDRREHSFVVDAVVRTLQAACSDVRARGPEAVRFADVTHLATTVTARARSTSALSLARALHPTPAVAGTPRAPALAAIARLEPAERGRYAGPCGWVDARGDGEWVVALRGAELDGAHARLFAGAGIVAGSDAGAEWRETQAKLQPMLAALIRP